MTKTPSEVATYFSGTHHPHRYSIAPLFAFLSEHRHFNQAAEKAK
jgi:hypothetical protein